MNSDPISTGGRSRRPLQLKLPFLALIAAACLGTGCFRVSTDTQALRDAAFENGEGVWLERIELSLGRLTFAAAQFGSRYVDLPAEARTLLDSVRGAEVSFWELQGEKAPELAKVLRDADLKMLKRGWTRLVGVVNEKELVAVYLPADTKSAQNVRVCVLVLSQKQLVCASARSDLEPLMQLALGKLQENSEFARQRTFAAAK